MSLNKTYVYIMRLRPPGPGCQPNDGLIETTDDEIPFHGRKAWGTARYSRVLTDMEEEHYDMEYLGIVEE